MRSLDKVGHCKTLTSQKLANAIEIEEPTGQVILQESYGWFVARFRQRFSHSKRAALVSWFAGVETSDEEQSVVPASLESSPVFTYEAGVLLPKLQPPI